MPQHMYVLCYSCIWLCGHCMHACSGVYIHVWQSQPNNRRSYRDSNSYN